ncbi:MAG TPA: flagellar biosynthesis anti-sigma factor FlgM [Tepidiformaceae bacterium]|jgi:negative regulator of flagellin synthesis FlgM|nr:flagellar biosynthesis anti-sigma factor FlgM [Thermoflexaceae bacterium]HMS58505.1 flagellar biosynthesis anti-sigma factor FlgM [Tepidiformaceae bacterium]
MADVGRTRTTGVTGAVVYDFSRAQARRAASATATPADTAGISEDARELSRAREAVEAAPDVRADRVRSLQQQIRNGNYNPDPREVAKRIMERGL